MFKTILIIFGLTLMMSGCANTEKSNTPNNMPTQPANQSEPDLGSNKSSMTSKECQEKGGGVITSEFEKQDCPNGKEYLGEVNDLDCFCSCCK